MTVKMVIAVLSLAMAAGLFGEERSAWKSASKQEREIEYQWARPARNSCEVSFRDLRLKSKTTLAVVIQYLPHRAVKQSVETAMAEVAIGVAGSDSKHIVSCEQVMAVSISGVKRE